MGLFFFNQRKPREFRHDPIYFDPRKDALEDRIKKVKKDMGELPEEEYKPNLKGSFVNQSSHVRRRHESEGNKSNASRNIILAVALVLLGIVFYYMTRGTGLF